MPERFPSKLPVRVNRAVGLRMAIANPTVDSKPNTVIQKSTQTKDGRTIFRNVVRIGHKDNEMYRKTDGVASTRTPSVKERVEPLVRVQKSVGKDCKNKYGNVTSKIDTGIRKLPTSKPSANISSNKREVTTVHNLNVKSLNTKTSGTTKTSRDASNTVRKAPVKRIVKPQVNAPAAAKKFDKTQQNQRSGRNHQKVDHRLRSSSTVKRKSSENIQVVGGMLNDAKKPRGGDTTTVTDAATVNGQEVTKENTAEFGNVVYFSEASYVTISDSPTNIVKENGISSVGDTDLIKSISSFVTVGPSCNINSEVWKKCACYVLRKRKTTWEGECKAQIPEKHLQEFVDRESKNLFTEKPLKSVLNDVYMTVYTKWYAFQQISSRVAFGVFEIRPMMKTCVQTVIRGGLTTTISHETDKFLCVKNVHRDAAFGLVSAVEIYRNKLFYMFANDVWSLSLMNAGLPVMEYENSQPLQSFSVFGEEMHCLTKDTLVLDVCSLENPKNKSRFVVSPSYKCSQHKKFVICDEGVIVGVYYDARAPDNQIFEVFMLGGGKIRSVHCQNVAGIFSSYISCIYCYGSTFLLGLESGVVVMYHVTSWDAFNLAKHVKMFEGFQGGIRSIHVRESEFQRIFVVDTDCKMYEILGFATRM